MDSNSEEGREDQHLGDLPQDMIPYKVSYSHGRSTKRVDKNEELNKKRCPVGRSGNNPGRVKRVVSCKRKTHHPTVARKKQSGCGTPGDMANMENAITCMQDMQQEIFHMDLWEVPPNANNNHKTGRTSSKHTDCFTLTEVRNSHGNRSRLTLARDHGTMTSVLYGRNLRLKVAFTLWQRNVGELLTYFLRIQDTGVFVDFLPLITKSITEDSPSINIGCCIDLFPLVKNVLTHPYEEYLIVGLKWIRSILNNWWVELRASGFSGSTNPLDKNFQVFNQQLSELWHQEPFLKSVPGAAGDNAKAIDLFLSQLI